MADDYTQQRLDEIDAKKEAERKARAKKKAAEAKADAEYKKQQETKDQIAKENMQRASTESAGSPQIEAGQAARKEQRIKRDSESSVRTKISNEYSRVYRVRENAIEKYGKTGDPKDKQAALSAQANLEPIVAEYVKVYGEQPPGYRPESSLSATPSRSEGSMRQEAKPVSEAQSRDTARSAGRNGFVAPAVVAQVVDPNIQRIIDAAAKSGIQLSIADATAALGLPVAGSGSGSVASTRRQTTQYSLQQVRSAADNIYQNSIGRTLNDEELNMLHKSLNSTLRENPNVTKTSAQGDVVTSGGIDERGFMEQQAQVNPEFASYQKATTYFDAMLSTLRGPVGGGI